MLKARKKPCGSCPYRKDVPSGIWSREEYEKLPEYDGETWEQNPALFLCHSKSECLCSGWLATHDPRDLLALRLSRNIHENVFVYRTDVPVFASGQEAHDHGVADIDHPSEEALRLMNGLMKLPHTKGKDE